MVEVRKRIVTKIDVTDTRDYQRIIEQLRFESCEAVVQWCYLLYGYRSFATQKIMMEALRQYPDVEALYKQAIQATKDNILQGDYRAYDYFTATFTDFLNWYVCRTNNRLLPHIRELILDAASIPHGKFETYIRYDVRKDTKEGDPITYNEWESVAHHLIEREGCNYIHASHLACWCNEIHPVRGINTLLHIFPDQLQNALGCDAHQAEMIQRDYEVVREYFKGQPYDLWRQPDGTYERALLGDRWGESISNISIDAKLIEDNKPLEFPRYLQQAINAINTHNERINTDPIYYVNSNIREDGHALNESYLTSLSYGIGMACFLLLGITPFQSQAPHKERELYEAVKWMQQKGGEQNEAVRYLLISPFDKLYEMIKTDIQSGQLPVLYQTINVETYEYELLLIDVLCWAQEKEVYIRPQLRNWAVRNIHIQGQYKRPDWERLSVDNTSLVANMLHSFQSNDNLRLYALDYIAILLGYTPQCLNKTGYKPEKRLALLYGILGKHYEHTIGSLSWVQPDRTKPDTYLNITFAETLAWFESKQGQILPEVEAVLRKFIGYFDEPVPMDWEAWKAARIEDKHHYNKQPVEHALCWLHGFTPLRDTQYMILHRPDAFHEALGCDEDTARAIINEYNELLERHISKLEYYDNGSKFGYWIKTDVLKQILSEQHHNCELLVRLNELENQKQEAQRNSIRCINERIVRQWTRFDTSDIASHISLYQKSMGLAESCCMIMGYYREMQGFTRDNAWPSSPHIPFERMVYDNFYKRWHCKNQQLSLISAHKKTLWYCDITLYGKGINLLYCNSLDVLQANEALRCKVLHNPSGADPALWKVRFHAFVQMCIDLGVKTDAKLHVLIQLQRDDNTTANKTTDKPYATASGNALEAIVNELYRYTKEDLGIDKTSKFDEAAIEKNKAYYISDDFPISLKNKTAGTEYRWSNNWVIGRSKNGQPPIYVPVLS